MKTPDPASAAGLDGLLNRPLSVGKKHLKNRLALAPMTFLSHVAFRQLVDEFGGCGLLWTEMCSSRRVPLENPRISDCFRWRGEELSRLVCQLFGAKPAEMAAAAKRIAGEGLFGVDINFGCSVGAICRQNCGAALLKNPSRAAGIVAAVRRAVDIPLFVKFRTGWSDDPGAAVEAARRFQDAGADALVFHPRVAPDRRCRPPKWAYIGMVKEAVSVPVFGNGDVFSAQDCRRLVDKTGCDAVALGRLAVARPWIFARWTTGAPFGAETYPAAAFRLADLLEAHFSADRALRRYKKFAQYFSANFRFGNDLFNRLRNAQCMGQIRHVLAAFFDGRPELNDRPNMNLFH